MSHTVKIFALVFAVPAVVALLLWWRLARPDNEDRRKAEVTIDDKEDA
jgi:hypothetical protein